MLGARPRRRPRRCGQCGRSGLRPACAWRRRWQKIGRTGVQLGLQNGHGESFRYAGKVGPDAAASCLLPRRSAPRIRFPGRSRVASVVANHATFAANSPGDLPPPAPHPILFPPAHTGPGTATPMAFVQAIVLACRRAGLLQTLLQQAQITPQEVETRGPRDRLQFERLGPGHAGAGRRSLGWFSRRLPWGNMGCWHAPPSAPPTLGVALQRWCRHHGLLQEDISLHLDSTGGWPHCRSPPAATWGRCTEFCLVSVLRNAHGLACWLIDSRIPCRVRSFRWRPAHHGALCGAVPGPVRFDTGPAAFMFDARYLALPPQRDETALRLMLQRALPLTVLQYRRDRLLVQRAPGPGHPTAGDAQCTEPVRLFHLSARTLHHQLGKAPRSVIEERGTAPARHGVAAAYAAPDQAGGAGHAGFLNEKSLSGPSGLTGHTPAEWRQRNSPQPDVRGRGAWQRRCCGIGMAFSRRPVRFPTNQEGAKHAAAFPLHFATKACPHSDSTACACRPSCRVVHHMLSRLTMSC